MNFGVFIVSSSRSMLQRIISERSFGLKISLISKLFKWQYEVSSHVYMVLEVSVLPLFIRFGRLDSLAVPIVCFYLVFHFTTLGIFLLPLYEVLVALKY